MTASKLKTGGSLVVRIGSMLFLLGILIVASTVTGFVVFRGFSQSTAQFQGELVPSLRESSEMVDTAGDIGRGLSAVLMAGSEDDLRSAAEQIRSAIETLRAAAKGLGENAPPAMDADFDALETLVPRLVAARIQDIGMDERTLSGADDLTAAAAIATDGIAKLQKALLLDVSRGDTVAGSAGLQRVRDLLDRSISLERAIQSIQSVVLTGASADDAAGVERAGQTADELASRINDLSAALSLDYAVTAAIDQVLTQAAGDESILDARGAVIEARADADEASSLAAAKVDAIAAAARGLGQGSVSEISSASEDLAGSAARGRAIMLIIGAISVAVLAFTAVGSMIFAVRPLLALTRVTERLAQGDMAPVQGFERQGGEIARMAAALGVFRNNMLERTRLEEEEREREVEAHRREVEARGRAEAEQRAREDAERKRKAEAEAAERAREASERLQKEDARVKLEAERTAHAAEQERIVSALAAGLKGLAAGDLDTRIDNRFPDAYEQLRVDFNDALGTLSEVIGGLAESASRIDNNSSEIASASNDLSHRTEEQAAALEETAAALEELTASVRAAAQHAEQADQNVTATRNNASESGRVVREAVAAMGELEKSSEHISQIVGVIDDIAFQTNLLALNAGVEAARAGDAGRGFAVVASEVRSLAQRSSEAAKEIKALISASSDQVERGVDLVRQTGSSLETIVDAVSGVAKLVSDMAAAAREQSAGLSEINTSVNQLDRVTQQNAAMVEEATAASNDLKSEAQTLAGLFSRFKASSIRSARTSSKDHRPAGGSKPASASRPIRPQGNNKPAPRRVSAVAGSPAAVARREPVDDWSEF